MKVFIQDFKTKTTFLEENVNFLPKRALLTRKMPWKRATFRRNRLFDLKKYYFPEIMHFQGNFLIEKVHWVWESFS